MIRREIKMCRAAAILFMLIILLNSSCSDSDSQSFNIFVSPEGSGTVLIEPEAQTDTIGSEVTLTAMPVNGWRFDRWEGNVSDPYVPITELVIRRHIDVTAHFLKVAEDHSSRDSAASAVVQLDAKGAIIEEAFMEVPGGSSLTAPKGVALHTGQEEGPLKNSALLSLQDIPAADISPVNFTTWVWAFEVAAEHPDAYDDVHFTSHDSSTIPYPDPQDTGLLHETPLTKAKVNVGEAATLYRWIDHEEGGFWTQTAITAVETGGISRFSILQTGRYAIGHRTALDPQFPPPGVQLFDCVVEFDTRIYYISVVDPSNAQIFGIWNTGMYIETPIPETTDWFYKRFGSEEAWGRFENYGKQFRVRSKYANPFSSSVRFLDFMDRQPDLDGNDGLAVAQARSIKQMAGPFPVPSTIPLEDPYDLCELPFATEVLVKVLVREGNWGVFSNKILKPLRKAYPGLSNVIMNGFRAIHKGFYVEIRVRTEDCAKTVGQHIPLAQEEGVISRFNGRIASIYDPRGLGPFVAYYTLLDDVALTTGLRFADPFWDIIGGITDDHVLGGWENPMGHHIDMDYNPITDTLWIVTMESASDDPEAPGAKWVLSRYDNPINNSGDRPSDFRIDFNDSYVDRVVLDPEHDRLFVLYRPRGHQGWRIHVYSHASTTPVLENKITQYQSQYPLGGIDWLMHVHLAPMGDILYMYSQFSWLNLVTEKWEEGLIRWKYNLATETDHIATYDACAIFKGFDPPIGKSVFSAFSKDLFISSDNRIYRIEKPHHWHSTWDNNECFPDQIRVVVQSWNDGPGEIWHFSIIDDARMLMSVTHWPRGWEMGFQIVLFNASVNWQLKPSIFMNFPWRVILGNQLINPPYEEEDDE